MMIDGGVKLLTPVLADALARRIRFGSADLEPPTFLHALSLLALPRCIRVLCLPAHQVHRTSKDETPLDC